MAEHSAKPNATELISHAKTLYRQLPKAEHTLAIREALGEALADPAGLDRTVLVEAHALRGLNLVCDYLNHWNDTGEAHLADAEQAVQKAFEIDPDFPYAHYANGFIQRAKGNHEAAVAAFAEMVKRNPGFARAYAQQANELINVGRPAEALPLVEQAMRLGPNDLSLGMFYWIKGRAHFYAGNYRDAAGALERSVELRSDLWYNRLFLVSACALAGDKAAAANALKDFATVFPAYSIEEVVRNEGKNPNDHPLVVAGREQFHNGLRAAGMPG